MARAPPRRTLRHPIRAMVSVTGWDRLDEMIDAPLMPLLPPSLQLSAQFNPVRLQADLDGILAGDYVPHVDRGVATRDWAAVPLRRDERGIPGGAAAEPRALAGFADTPFLERCPYVRQVLAFFQCTQQAIEFRRIKPGAVAREPRNNKLGFAHGLVRLHIPVVTSSEFEFLLRGKRVVMNEGECWYHDLTVPHGAANRGQSHCIHLTIDCVVNEWLRAMLIADSVAARPRVLAPDRGPARIPVAAAGKSRRGRRTA